MAQSAAWVLLALVTLQVAAAYPSLKLRDGDASDVIAQALAQANRAKTEAESALNETLQAAAIGDLPAAQAASDRAALAGNAAWEQNQRAETVAVRAAGDKAFAVGTDVSTYAQLANYGACRNIISAFDDAIVELTDFVWQANENQGSLPREEVESEIGLFNNFSVSVVSEFNRILDDFILDSKRAMAEANKQISIWEVEVHQVSDAANAALVASAAAQEAYHQATTPAPTPATTDAPTQSPTNSPTAAPTDAPTQAPTDAPHNIRRKRSSDVDPFGAAKLVLLEIDSDYSAYASSAKDNAEFLTKDAFDTAADVIDNIQTYYEQDDFQDSLNKMGQVGYLISATVGNQFSVFDQAVSEALKSLEN